MGNMQIANPSSPQYKHRQTKPCQGTTRLSAGKTSLLVFGATGLLGQALVAEGRRRGVHVAGAARRGSEFAVDLTDARQITELFARLTPTLVNARAVAIMAEQCRISGARFVHVSTDHFFTGDGPDLHAEDSPVALVNEYARSKYAGEGFARILAESLVIRTNITGFRGWPSQPTFAEWAVDAILNRRPLKLFDDFYTSTIDADAFAGLLFQLIDRERIGLVNLASSTVSSKLQFIHALAAALGVQLDWADVASVRDLPVARAESAGLDVSKAERLLGHTLPTLQEVCGALVSQYRTCP
jgi:dTDP-4-dehydrorhamnose reductase